MFGGGGVAGLHLKDTFFDPDHLDDRELEDGDGAKAWSWPLQLARARPTGVVISGYGSVSIPMATITSGSSRWRPRTTSKEPSENP